MVGEDMVDGFKGGGLYGKLPIPGLAESCE